MMYKVHRLKSKYDFYILPLAKENKVNTEQMVNAFLLPNFMNANGARSDAITSTTPTIMD